MPTAHETYGDRVKIEFLPSSDEVVAYIPAPKPAKAYMPERIAKMPIFAESPKLGSENYKGMTAKGCLAFLDTFSAGYIQELWCDLHVDVNRKIIKSSRDPQPLYARPGAPTILAPGLEPTEFTWKQPWIPRMPKGWSILITNPVNHADLPFTTVAGIIDADEFFHTFWGNLPVYFREGYEGVLPKGTPLFQMIPIKREDWQREIREDFTDADRLKLETTTRSKFYGVYQKFFHKRKRYE